MHRKSVLHCTDGCFRRHDDGKARRCSLITHKIRKGYVLEDLLDLLGEVLRPDSGQLRERRVLLPSLMSPLQLLSRKRVKMAQWELFDAGVPAWVEEEGYRQTGDTSFRTECSVFRTDIAATCHPIKDIAHYKRMSFISE